MKFESQVCTNREQSERLMSLGLKSETADMMLVRDFCYLTNEPYRETIWTPSIISAHDNFQEFVDSMTTTLKGISKQFVNDGYKPAWSLHRLIEMMPNAFQDEQYRNFVLKVNSQEVSYVYSYVDDDGYGQSDSIDVDDNFYNLYDGIIAHIKWLIKKGLFNTDYLTK